MITIPAALAAITAFGATILGALGPAAALLAGVGPLGTGLTVAGAGAGSALVGGAAVAGASNPHVFGGIQNAAADAYNNAVLGSSNVMNMIHIPGVPMMHPR